MPCRVEEGTAYSEAVQAWINKHWPSEPEGVSCPVCRSDNWLAEGKVFNVPRKAPDNHLSRPMFPVVCQVCFYTLWVAAVSAGVDRSVGVVLLGPPK